MMRSLYSGVSGLRNHQTKMDVIGDNISNVNTVGFKKSRVTFQDLLTQTMRGASAPQGNRGGVNAMQVGLGMGIGSIDVIDTQGNLQNTGKTTDVAIDGDGYVILQDGANRFYTRTGTLDVDKNGDLIMSSNGLKVVGWSADATGAINNSNTTGLGSIRIPLGQSIPALKTTMFTYSKNLNPDSAKPISTSVDFYDSQGGLHSVDIEYYKNATSGTNLYLDTNTSTEINLDNTTVGNSHSYNMKVYDDSNQLHNLTVTIETASAYSAGPPPVPATYNVTVNEGTTTLATMAGIDTTDPLFTSTDGTTGGVQITLSGSDTFRLGIPAPNETTSYSTGSGLDVDNPIANTWQWRVTSSDSAITGITGGTGTVNFSANGDYSGSAGGPLSIALSNGTDSPQSIALDLSGMTQYSGDTTVTGKRDGYASGSLQSISLDTNGVITGTYSNGLTQSIGQIALAVFSNPAGLTKLGGSLYTVSNNSGDPEIGVSNTGGRGKVTPGALEMSNVDLAQEFTDMITTQRGFQANSKIITTTDQMLEELVNLKR